MSEAVGPIRSDSSGGPGGSREHLGAGAMQPKRRGATSTVEDYLKCILNEQGVWEKAAKGAHEDAGTDGARTVSMGTLGSALGVAPGTVTAMMKALAESGLVDYAPYAGVTLTDAGRKLATHVLRRHRLIELFLVETMGLCWSEVHEEAELLEHAISDRLIARMDEMLGFPTVDPHGDPIPSADGQVAEPFLLSLLECSLQEPQHVVRVLDQSATFLRGLEAQGLVRGAMVLVLEQGNDGVLVELLATHQDGETLKALERQIVLETPGGLEGPQTSDAVEPKAGEVGGVIGAETEAVLPDTVARPSGLVRLSSDAAGKIEVQPI